MHMTILMINTLAIEGEEGSNPELYWRMHAAYERLWQDGVLRDGASFEGMGHNNVHAVVRPMFVSRLNEFLDQKVWPKIKRSRQSDIDEDYDASKSSLSRGPIATGRR